MEFDLTIKNYRCFPSSEQVHLKLRRGFTAFLGANNSGKSSLLKFFLEFRDLFRQLSQFNLEQIPSIIPEGSRIGFDLHPTVTDAKAMFCKSNEIPIEIEISFYDESPDEIPHLRVITLTVERDKRNASLTFHGPDGPFPKDGNFQIEKDYVRRDDKPLFRPSKFHEVVSSLVNTMYIGPYRNALSIGGGGVPYYDIQVGKDLVETWSNYKTGPSRAQNEAMVKLTNEIARIFKYGNLEINATADTSTLQLIVEGKSFVLQEVGSGIAHFIVVLANAVFKNPDYIMIDEPELNLHPSLQLDFLTTLAAYAKVGVLFSTHNIGLARSSADRIYTVHRIEEGLSQVKEYEETARLSEFLGELNYSNYSILGFDKILLVEGQTEVKTIQQFLRLYKKEHQIVLLPLGGSGGIKATAAEHLEEVKRITEKVSVLIDSEREKKGAPLSEERQMFLAACKKAGVKGHALDLRATENYFTERAIKTVKGSEYKALEPYKKLKTLNPRWSKSENWRIAREMTMDELKDTDLGKFLGSL